MNFSADHRVLQRQDFVRCYQVGRRYHANHFMIFVSQRENGQGYWRLGLAVTRKTGGAVQRNRVKRVVREFFRLHQAVLPAGVDMVVIPKRGLKSSHLSLHTAAQDFLPFLAALAKSIRL